MSEIAVGATIEISFDFIYDADFVDPDTLTGEIFKDEVLDSSFSPTQTSTGRYTYNWTPAESGSFELRLTGEFLDSTPDLVNQKYFLIGGVDPTYEFATATTITYLGELSPVYLDPEVILIYYPDGDLVEITEIIHRKSLDLESRLGCTNLTNLTETQYNYLIAATMCELSRVYGIGSDTFGGFSSADSFSLGDLEVSKSTGAGGSNGGSYDLGNADTWCELAAVLREQLVSTKDKLRPVVPGAIYKTPIPTRELKSSDY